MKPSNQNVHHEHPIHYELLQEFCRADIKTSTPYILNLRQLRRMTILETGTIACLFVTLWSGEHNGLLSILLSIIGSMIYGAILIAIGRCDGGYYAMAERCLPSLIWRGVWCLYSIRYSIHGAWLMSFLIHMIRQTLYDRSDWMILLPLLIVSIYAGAQSPQAHARFAELLFWWVILPLAGIFLYGIWKSDLSISMTVSEIIPHEIIRDEYRMMILFLPMEFSLFRMSALSTGNGKSRIWRSCLLTILLSGSWMLLVYIVTLGILGNQWGHHNLLGVTDAMEQIIGWNGALERMDILILLFWLIGGLFSLSSYLFQGQQLLQRAFVIRGISSSYSGAWWAILIETGLTFAIYHILPSAQDWTTWYRMYACYIDFPLSIGIPILIWGIYQVRIRRTPPAINHRIQTKDKAVKEFLLFLALIPGLFICLPLTGCTRSADSLEDRAYVKELHISKSDDTYHYRCVLSYLSRDSMELLHTELEEGNESNHKSPERNESDDNEQENYEYSGLAPNIREFNGIFHSTTNCSFDYSHLQGIYLNQQLYPPDASGSLMQDIRSSTKAVLSTPIYEEGIRIGDQQEVTLGERLRYHKEHDPD